MKASEKKRRNAGKAEVGKARLLALDILCRWNQADLDREEQLATCSDRDRALVKNLVNGTLRMRGQIDYYLDKLLKDGTDSLQGRVLDILRMAVFQLRFCDRIPDYAVVNDAVELVRPLHRGNYVSLVNGVLRSFIRDGDKIDLPSKSEDPSFFLAVKYSHPRWLVSRYVERFGLQSAEALLKANNEQAPLMIRSRSGELEGKLAAAGVKVGKGAYVTEALVVEEQLPPSKLPGYEEGLFYVQDEAQMLVGGLASPKPGSTVADFCAAPGGKVSHLAELAGPGSLVLAADNVRRRLEKVKDNLVRLGLCNVHLIVADARKPAVKRADLVLCDVPCSGTGVFRRKPELRWRVQPQNLMGFNRLQKDIISAASRRIAEGGVLIYSTCSLEPEENCEVVDWFLSKRKDFEIESAKKYVSPALVSERGFLETFPHRHGIDGVFAARLRRKVRG
ncbi:16S rRNA (cytosine(967)-C(5))-methyltransferase RsmB [Gemmatimonadota bacterium]